MKKGDPIRVAFFDGAIFSLSKKTFINERFPLTKAREGDHIPPVNQDTGPVAEWLKALPC